MAKGKGAREKGAKEGKGARIDEGVKD